MQAFKAIRDGIEVRGQAIVGLTMATGSYSGLALKILARHGIREIDVNAWYPQQACLDVYRDVLREIGPQTMFQIGRYIPDNALWPEEIKDVEAAFRFIDVAYHMNHRLDGAPMVDVQTGAMAEGIGHFRCARVGKRRIDVVCDTPYPSENDRGVIVGCGRKFEPTLDAVLDESQSTRLRGARSCTFITTW
ncbi:hypothetical protein WME90_32305 [Sorangium sp. So ce375]|uniref:hypothetical protein n=1 Tax=Sorangium sp. So ce375 TaxID=3133306 RepID=UPI003F5AF01B